MANFNLPEGVDVIDVADRAADGKYFINPVRSSVFPLTINTGQIFLISVADQFLQDRQDLSMRFWLSSRPFSVVDIKYNIVPQVFSIRKMSTSFLIFDNMIVSSLSSIIGNNVIVPINANTTIYLNVQNLVPQKQTFVLIINEVKLT